MNNVWIRGGLISMRFSIYSSIIKKRALARTVVLVALMCSCSMRATIPSDTLTPVKFLLVRNIPVVEATLNGKRGRFIVDTGASVSIIHHTEVARFGLTVRNFADYGKEIAGLGGNTFLQYAGSCSLELGGRSFNDVLFTVNDLSPFVSVIYGQERIRIHGILGADILYRYRLRIDFLDQTLSF